MKLLELDSARVIEIANGQIVYREDDLSNRSTHLSSAAISQISFAAPFACPIHGVHHTVLPQKFVGGSFSLHDPIKSIE